MPSNIHFLLQAKQSGAWGCVSNKLQAGARVAGMNNPLASNMPAETQCLSLFSVDLHLQLKVPVCHCEKVKDEGV